MDIAKLKTLLASPHPVSGAWQADDAAAAVQGNVVDCEENITSLSGNQLFTATNGTEFAALTDAKRSNWISWCNTDRDPWNEVNVAFVDFIFGDNSATKTALAALRKRAVSLFQKNGLGFVYPGHIENART